MAKVMKVGPDVLPALDPPPRPEPAEGADDRVADEQDPVLGAQVGDALDVAVGRQVYAAGADHRLAEEGGHALVPLDARTPPRAPASESCATRRHVTGTSGPQLLVFASIPPSEVPKPCVPW